MVRKIVCLEKQRRQAPERVIAIGNRDFFPNSEMAKPSSSVRSKSSQRWRPAVPRDQLQRPRRRWGIADILVLALLLVFPLLALHKFCTATGRYGWIGYGVLTVISLASFSVMVFDKKSAERGRWRIPEKVLHQLEFFGGWPGSFLAQRIFWHKVSKTSYQVVFWFIVFVYEFVSIDYLQGWKWLRWLGAQF